LRILNTDGLSRQSNTLRKVNEIYEHFSIQCCDFFNDLPKDK